MKLYRMKSIETIKLITILFSVIFMLNSCSKKDGEWDDIIELSQKEVNFNSTADSINITTKGEGWWISNISLDDEQVNFESVNTTDPSFDINETEFVISRKSATELQIKITENSTMEQRELIIGMQAGNYFDAIKIIQRGK